MGNTDAEERPVLCEMLDEATDSRPSVLLDFATLTGSARVARGPDLLALFCNDDVLAVGIEACGRAVHNPLWRLPLWQDYDSRFDGERAELSNVAGGAYAGAVVAALFPPRVVLCQTRRAHLGMHCEDDTTWPNDRPAARREGRSRRWGALKRIVSPTSAQQ